MSILNQILCSQAHFDGKICINNYYCDIKVSYDWL